MPRAAFVPQIEVTFELDINGIVHVRAQDLASGVWSGMSVVLSGGLSDSQVKQLRAQRDVPEEIKVFYFMISMFFFFQI